MNSKISDVVDIMSEKELHRIPVISGKKLVGLVTEGMLSLIHILLIKPITTAATMEPVKLPIPPNTTRIRMSTDLLKVNRSGFTT